MLEKESYSEFISHKKNAENGDASAQYKLGRFYELGGDGVNKNMSLAIRWYYYAVGQGYPPALLRLGQCYYDGLGLEENRSEGMSLMLKAAEQDFAEAQFYIGQIYSQGKGVTQNKFTAFNWYRKAAKLGHSEAQFRVGSSYYLGIGVEADEAEAIKWYQKAVNQGHSAAQFCFGICVYGQGNKKDKAELIKWYRKATEQGDATAQCNLGYRYDLGQGVEQDKAEAVRWYRKAAEQGHVTAQFNLGVHYTNGEGVEKDETEAVRWYRKAAEQGHVTAQFNLGVHYTNGQGVEKDQAEAVRWYRKAAEQGHVTGQFYLGVHYANGEGVEKDETEAVRWYRKAAEQGHVTAQYNLGVCYKNGQGVEVDLGLAVHWFRLAASQDHVDAQVELAFCYRMGIGVDFDDAEAVYWYKKAAEQGSEIAAKNLDIMFWKKTALPEIQSTSKGLTLNPQQEKIIQHLKGPLLIHAPAGSGKTLLLALRTEQALQAGFKPDEILCITFTNLAARHLRQRVEQNAPAQARHIWMSTFHGFCASFLRMEAKHVGLPADFVIFDEEDCKSLLKTIITNRDLSKIITPSALLMTFDKAKAKADQSSLLLEGYDGHDLEAPLSQEIYKAYSKELINRHALDFSDLIYYVRAALANIPDIKQKWAQRFKFIQVDEIQDTHMAEYEVIHTLAAKKNIAAFGDLDQSIYGWRGAEPTKVRNRFIKDFSPEIFNLPYNYRATKTLIQAADSFAGRAFEERHNELMPDESCPDGDTIVVHHALNEDGESTWIEEQIHVLTSKKEQQFKDIAVICRTNQKARQIASVLEDQDIPCLTVDQYHFFRRQEIKDALAILKLLINPYDVSSAHRISLSFLKGVGKATVSRILNEGAGIGLRLTDFFNKETFDNQEPFGRLIQAYGQGLLTVIDAETTGINPVADNIIELAYCTLDAGRKSQRWSSLVRSDKPVGSSVHVHGITDEKLNSEGISPEDGLNKLFNDILFGLVVGHNVSFDLATIRSQAGRVGLGASKPFLGHKFNADTCEIARRFIDVKSYRLEDLCDELNLPRRESHRAMGDVDNTVELLGYLMPYVKKHQSERIEFIQRYRHFFEPAANIFNTIHSFAHNNRPGDVLNKALELFNMVNVYEQEPHRVDNLNYLVSLFHEQDRKNLSPWDSLHTLVQFASLSKSLDHLSENENKVIVAPIHQSKGLEFSSVFIAGAVDGFIPIFNSQDIEEEKRLFYVAMTRPRKKLFITGFKEYVTKKGFVVQKSMTPFLDYIDGRLFTLKQDSLSPDPPPPVSESEHSAVHHDPFDPQVNHNEDKDHSDVCHKTEPESIVSAPVNKTANIRPETRQEEQKTEYYSDQAVTGAVLGLIIGLIIFPWPLVGIASAAAGYVIGHLLRMR